MLEHYIVRFGVRGEIARFRAIDGTTYRRGQRVLCDTDRGLFVGQLLASTAAEDSTTSSILRRLTAEDELLQARLERFKAIAVEECRQHLREQNQHVELLDVDHLFDGRTLYFYFLGEPSEELSTLTDALAQRYESRVRTGHFAKLLAEGCGPGCGTKEKSGCGTDGGCAVCVVAKACRAS